MDLLLIRHASAEDGDDDFARPLSKKGRKRLADVVRGLDALGVRSERVLHSPRLRAVQTAELLAPVLRGTLEVCAGLDAPADEALLAQLEDESLALVGHEPHLSGLLAWLVTGDQALGRAFLIKKGAIALLTGEPRPGRMQLASLLSPRVFRATH